MDGGDLARPGLMPTFICTVVILRQDSNIAKRQVTGEGRGHAKGEKWRGRVVIWDMEREVNSRLGERGSENTLQRRRK